MRIVAFAVAVLSLAALTQGPATAQNSGPGPYADDPRSGPPPYFTDRPPRDGERAPYSGDRPPQRGSGQGFPPPPPYRGAPPEQAQRYDNRPPDPRSAPPQRDREPPPMQRVEQGPPPRPAERRVERPPQRGMERTMVSISEFRELEGRVRELERLLERRDFREEQRGPNRPPPTIYR